MELMVKSDTSGPAMIEKDEPHAQRSHGEAKPRIEAFTVLMRQHHRELLVYARAIVYDHHTAQDIVQDALVTAFDKFDQFDHNLDFAKWIRGFIRFKSLDWFRKQKRLPLPDTTLVEIELNLVAWEEPKKLGENSLSDAMVDCIAQLPEGLKDAVIEYYLQDNSGPEIAEKLDISPATVRKRLERARTHLHTCLTEKSEK